MGFKNVDNCSEVIKEYRKELVMTWDEMSKEYQCPVWFRDAKFGIWAHWGPQCVPEKGEGWYARHMYMPGGGEGFGKDAYSYHCRTYGHPSQFGFKDVINEWKAEKFDADKIMAQCEKWGARYFAVTANHHDHFDLFDSTWHDWNSTKVGPKRDIVGEFEKAARKKDIKFSVAVHDNNHWSWLKHAFDCDKEGPYAGIPYDGRMTKEDGKGKWWEGLDPADLYGPPPEERTEEKHKAEKEKWFRRMCELVDRYAPDMIYYDWPVNKGFIYDEYGQAVMERLYNNHLKKNGRLDAIAQVKRRQPGTVYVIEKGYDTTISEQPYQIETTFLEWFYKRDKPLTHSARSIIEYFVDCISKNANMLLSVELLPDGTYPEDIAQIMDTVGNFMRVNSEAIYSSRPWFIYGDGPYAQNPVKGTGFCERTAASEPYDHNEVRFTRKGEDLFIFAMNPSCDKLVIPSCGKYPLINLGVSLPVESITFLETQEQLRFEQNDRELVISMPSDIQTGLPVCFKVKFYEGNIGVENE